MTGVFTDPPLAARFHTLAQLPAGTLGRRFHDDFTARGLALPGEPRGLPERMIHHDLMHVINDYGTDPAGECELAGFYAAFCPGDSFTFMVIVMGPWDYWALMPLSVEQAREQLGLADGRDPTHAAPAPAP